MPMAFDPNRWTLRTQEAVQAAVEMARTQSHPEVTPDHLVTALLEFALALTMVLGVLTALLLESRSKWAGLAFGFALCMDPHPVCQNYPNSRYALF